MLKIRVMGSISDIRWFRKVIENCKEIQVINESKEYPLECSNRFFRRYIEIDRMQLNK